VGFGIGVGIGYGLAYWDPYYYDAYGTYWVNGCPPFGFGSVYYGPTYAGYFADPIYVEVPTPVVVESAPVVAEPQPAPEFVGGPEVPDAEAVPGEADFAAGVDAFMEGDYATALKFFRRAVQADEENGEAWMAIMHAAFAVGVFDEAADAIERAALLGAFPRGYRHDPRPMYPVKGRFEALLERLQTFRKKHPDYADAHLIAAYFHVALGEKAEANEAIVQLLKLRPDDETAPILTLAMLPPLPPAEAPTPEPVAPQD
jgi:tetratricopeptide (TPR) repeat protein